MGIFSPRFWIQLILSAHETYWLTVSEFWKSRHLFVLVTDIYLDFINIAFTSLINGFLWQPIAQILSSLFSPPGLWICYLPCDNSHGLIHLCVELLFHNIFSLSYSGMLMPCGEFFKFWFLTSQLDSKMMLVVFLLCFSVELTDCKHKGSIAFHVLFPFLFLLMLFLN